MGETEGDSSISRHLRAVVFTNDWPTDTRALADFGGQLVGHRGRGVLATFDNCHNALLALASASETVSLSAGLAFGELAFEQGDSFGEAVVAAARLDSICPVGSVYCTEMARQHLDEFAAQDLGPIELKGIGTVRHHEFRLVDAVESARSQTVINRLDTAILSSDIVASTELLETKGTEAAIAVRRVFDEATASTFRAGTILHVRGDGVVARFSSATDAIRAGVELHRLVAAYGLASDSTPFSLRSAVAVGPDAEPDALALEASAQPGQILLSTTAQELAFDLADEVVVGVLAPQAPEAAPLPVELVRTDELPFVGRAFSLAALEESWKQALLGRAAAVFVTGEAGIGKTRLVSTFAQQCHSTGALVLFGSSDMEITAPYRPFAEALHDVVLPESASMIADRLRPLFPQEHRGEFPGATADGTATNESVGADRTQLFDALSNALAALSEARPVLLVLDDLHWSSSGTALLLRHLLHYPPTGRVMILGTFRDGEVDRTHPLSDVVNDQEVIGRNTRVALQNLTVDEVADLVGAHFSTEVGEREQRLATRIHNESSGLPFFTSEVLRHLDQGNDPQRRGVGNVASADTLALPATLVDAIHQRLGRLDAATCRMLETAATAGLVFELDVVAETLGTTFGALVEQLESAQRLGLVREAGRAGYFQFDHALVRSALLAELSATRVSMIHKQIAEALDRLPGDRNDALAHHWGQARGPIARQRAVRHLVQSAERDAAALAWEAAKVRYEDALERAGDDEVVDRAVIVRIHLARARAMRASGDPDYLAAMQETGRLARSAGLVDVIAEVAINSTKPGTWFANANEPDEHLIGLCEDALESPALEPSLRCRVLSTLATNLAFDDDRPRRRAIVEEAVDLARTAGDPDLIASALIARHLAFWDPSSLDDRIEIIEELDRLARRRDNPDHLFLAGFFKASMLIERGRVTEARDVLTDLDEPIRRTRNFWFRFLVDRVETALAVATRHPDAKAQVDKLFEGSFATQADAAGTWGAQLGGLAIQTGTFGSMVDQLAAASERSRGQGVWSCGLAIAQLDHGDEVGARTTLEGLKEAPLDFMWLVSQQMIAEAAYRLGDRERCVVTLERLRPYAGRVGVIASGTLVFALVSTSIGEAAIGAGDLDLAVTSLRSAVEQADELSLPFFAARSRRRLLEVLPPSAWGSTGTDALELATTHQFPSEIAALTALLDC